MDLTLTCFHKSYQNYLESWQKFRKSYFSKSVFLTIIIYKSIPQIFDLKVEKCLFWNLDIELILICLRYLSESDFSSVTSGSSSDSASTASEDEENGETTEEKTVKCKCNTGKSLSEAFLFAEHWENMLCTKIVLKVRNNFCTQHVLPRFELGIFMYWACNSMNNLLSYCGSVDAKIRASDKDLPVVNSNKEDI